MASTDSNATGNKIGTENILDMEANGIDYLYSLEHGQNNLFFAKFGDLDDSVFRISKINISSPTLNFERDNNRLNRLKGAALPEDVSITWIEDAYRSVEQYHLKWLRNWYDFAADFIPIGAGGKFKTLKIYAYHYVNKNVSISGPLMDADSVVEITLLNCVPTNMGTGYDFDWSGGGVKEFTTTYKFSQIYVNYKSDPKALPIMDLLKGKSTLYSNVSSLGLGSETSREQPKQTKEGIGTRADKAWSGVGVTNKAHSYSYSTFLKTYQDKIKKEEEEAAAAKAVIDQALPTEEAGNPKSDSTEQ